MASIRAVRVWKLPNGEPFHNLNHADWVFSVAISPDSKVLASGGADEEIKLWNLETGELLRTLTGHSHWVLSVAFSPDGAVPRQQWRGQDGQGVGPGGRRTAPCLRTPGLGSVRGRWSDGRFIAGGGEDGAIKVWDLETGKLIHAIAGHSGPVFSVAVSSDGQLLFSGGSDGKIKVWNLRTGEPLNVLSGQPEGVGSVALSPDGQLLASGGYDRADQDLEKGRNRGVGCLRPRQGSSDRSTLPSGPANPPTRPVWSNRTDLKTCQIDAGSLPKQRDEKWD